MFYNSIIEDEVVSFGVEWIDVGRVFKEPKIKGKGVTI